MDFTLYWFMFPVAIVVATCAMLSGIGGAALFTPIFVLVFPLLGPDYVLESTLAAVGTALITQTFGFLSGFVGYYRRRLIDFETAWRLLRVAVPVAAVGAIVAGAVPDALLIAAYAVLVFVLAIALWFHRSYEFQRIVPEESGQRRTIVDSAGTSYHYEHPPLAAGNFALTGVGAFLTGMVSVGIGEVTIAQLTRKHVPIAVAAATSVLVVIVTVVVASTTLALQLVNAGGWTAIPWDLLVYDIPGVLIGGQIGPRIQGLVAQRTMQRAIGALFVVLAVAMMTVAVQKFGA